MATHDYIISNASGAAVRSDLNNALSAIVSNNSSATEPTTTYAYMLWADTGSSPAVMKLRNSANTDWITLYKLDGTSLPSSSATEIAFNDAGADLDFRIEGDTEANLFFVDAGNDRVGIGTATPSTVLDVDYDHTNTSVSSPANAALRLQNTNAAANNYFTALAFTTSTTGVGSDSMIASFSESAGNSALGFYTDTSNGMSEKVRIDSSGRLLVGTDTVSGSAGSAPYALLQIEGNTFSGTGPGSISLRSGTASASIGSGGEVGQIAFAGNDNEEFALITCEADAATDSGDHPGRLIFKTTADGASSPTERMRIDRLGSVTIGAGSGTNTVIMNGGASSTSVNQFIFQGGGTGNPSAAIKYDAADQGLAFEVGNYSSLSSSERARIDTSGRLLVGTASSVASNALIQAVKSSGTINIVVNSQSFGNTNVCSVQATAGGRLAEIGIYKHSGISYAAGFLRLDESDSTQEFLWVDNSGNLRIANNVNYVGTTSGTVIGNQTSDERLKNVAGNVAYGLNEILQLQPKQYALKTEPDINKLGFIAQEVQSIIPEAVFDTNEELEGHQEGDSTKLGMEYVQLIPVLVNGIKEQQAMIETLKAKVAALESA